MNESKIFNRGFMAFVAAVIGVSICFGGFYIGVRSISILGFLITSVGVLVGLTHLVYFWFIHSKNAISNSSKEADGLRVKISRWWKNKVN